MQWYLPKEAPYQQRKKAGRVDRQTDDGQIGIRKAPLPFGWWSYKQHLSKVKHKIYREWIQSCRNNIDIIHCRTSAIWNQQPNIQQKITSLLPLYACGIILILRLIILGNNNIITAGVKFWRRMHGVTRQSEMANTSLRQMPVLGNVHPIKIEKNVICFRDVISLLARVFILLIDTATQEVPMKNIWKNSFFRYAIELLHAKRRTRHKWR